MRMDCPFCKNLNTLSVETTENNINWYCFHASCKARGKKEGEKNMQYVNKVLKGNQELYIENEEFKIPDSFKGIYSNEKQCVGYPIIIVGRLGLGVEQI